MSKLVVEIVDASDLMPKDGQGSASPFVEVEFDGQRQRTQTRFKDLNPQWNEKLVFNVGDFKRLTNKTIDVTVYDDRRDNQQPGKFLGRVKISGASVPLSESESDVQRYPLDKRGLFSNIKGDIALRIYAAPFDGSDFVSSPVDFAEKEMKEDKKFESQEFQNQNQNQNQNYFQQFDDEINMETMKPKKKEKESRTFHSIGAHAGAPPPQAKPQSHHHLPPNQPEFRSDYMRAPGPPPAAVMQMQVPRQNPEFQLIETSPPLAARMRQSYYYRSSGDKTSSTYDLVEQMHYLYVSVVKARDLPVMDVSGSLDPYVEVKLGNYKGLTKHLEKNSNPIWKQIFAFSKERLQSNLLEVTVKDKDLLTKDDFVGKVQIDLTEVPLRVPPDSPLAPQWYRLEDKKGMKTNRGEVMLAVWMGTQADESFPDAWHSDAHRVSHSNLSNTRSKVYFSPKLYYLRVHVIEAQDLVPSDKGRAPDAIVKVQAGNQTRATRTSQMRTINPQWQDELMFVVSEPFEDMVMVSVDDRIGPGKDEILGRVFIPVRDVPVRQETGKMPDPRWFSLQRHSMSMEEETEKRKEKFSSKILLRLCIEAGYHVLDESTHFSSDLQPSSKHLRKPSIGILELGILSARNLMPMKGKDGRMTDAYCVAKYGNKWVRTRTLLDALAPKWNEQYTWEVHDPCTVITIGVFDNGHINDGGESEDQRIGKVRVRLSTLETDRVYTHYYPLLVLTPGGLKKNGELQLALRYTCTSFVNMMAQYGRPLLPKMHYVQPIPVRYIDLLRHQAMQIVATRLSRSEPPLRREVVEYMLDVDYHMFSLRRSKANFSRIMSLLSSVTLVCKWFNDICTWRNPITTCLVHVLFLILVCYPELILPTIFLYLFVIGMWNYRYRPRHPPHMDTRVSQADNAHPDELDEEFDSFPTRRPADIVRMRYDRLRSVGGRVQTVVGDLATQGERIQALLSWRDPRATALFIVFALIWAVFIYVTPFQVIAIIIGLIMLRHPRFRSRMPSVPANFFKRLPAKSDMLL
ncbi:Multiple C2 domain and transmembrane region protein 6 [Cardamine amara subsp. amara]|uniref:Multiple C2 domain and transmembrane region protein 6 n=1 Tax=Cardamine amara subsp. amara TaxID=228776 RepID=A0ABD1C9F0_CARAN